jgi:sulfatase maturation enzyme AslB (radical SAM superfamily)
MSNQKIFCNVPWTNLHIYWDGSYGVCCFERTPPHQDAANYNIKTMPLDQWYNSKPIIKIRNDIKNDEPLGMCKGCYREEQHGYESKRIKENFKTVIFTEQAFERSYQQSPYYKDFETVDNTTTRLPRDWHVDLGNECNLACKMCFPQASSKISHYYDKWGLQTVSANNNWLLDDESFDNFKQAVLQVADLNRIHFMGGEPLLNKRFGLLLDFFLEHKPNLSLSFVTNGTYITQELIAKLKQFRTCDVEVSLESVETNNHYIRQGADTNLILDNIQRLLDNRTDTFNVVLRSVPQLLSVNNYDQYIEYAWRNKISVQGVPLTSPGYLQISVLPYKLRQTLKPRYQQLVAIFDEHVEFDTIVTGRNLGGLAQQLKKECEAIIHMLDEAEPANIDEMRAKLATWLMRWDREYALDARVYYPEYREFLDSIGYEV